MKFVTAPSGRRLLLVWRTELLFYTPERRRLASEWNQSGAMLRVADARIDGPDGARGERWRNVKVLATKPNARRGVCHRASRPRGVAVHRTPPCQGDVCRATRSDHWSSHPFVDFAASPKFLDVFEFRWADTAPLLESAGFHEIKVCAASESQIPDFGRYRLDLSADGSVRKPDSLFMEARKP